MCETKLVTYKHLKIGQEIKGYKGCGQRVLSAATVKAINSSFVTILKRNGIEEIVNTECMFDVEMTEEEIKKKYGKKAKEIFDALQNRLTLDEIGEHEYWNAWLSGDPYEMAAYCIGEKITILGYCPDITPKTAMFSGDTLDVGVCAEYNNGQRFWCHFRSWMLKEMKDMYPELVDKE